MWLKSDVEIAERSRRIVKHSRDVLAASRRAVPARWLSAIDREPNDHLLEVLAQLTDGKHRER